MLQIDSRALCKQENIVVQVSSLDSVFPCTADDGMYLSGKQGGQIIQINAVWRRSELILMLKRRVCGRAYIDLKFDLDFLIP